MGGVVQLGSALIPLVGLVLLGIAAAPHLWRTKPKPRPPEEERAAETSDTGPAGTTLTWEQYREEE